jgi:hypothetical protein
MADRFFDTSAAAKHYRTEVGSTKVDAFIAEPGSQHFISALAVVEFHSILARLVRTGHITLPEFHLARGRFLGDVAQGFWQVTPVSSVHFHRAQQLLVKHGLSRALRTLDAVQLSAAMELNMAMALSGFVCADANLCQIATAEGLVVINPEVP